MRRAALVLAFVLMSTGGFVEAQSEVKVEAGIEAMLKRIDPADRLEQICDYAAANRIGHDKNPYHPDRAVIDSISPVKIKGNTVVGSGGAFRSRGQWYQFSFVCKTTPDRLKILSFEYQIGERIPEDKWDDYGLWR